jgi:NAD(P)-dependent dehydrogenase (short-subunit alcohol dehydrogenase family)
MTKPRVMKPADGTIWVTGASSGIGKALVFRLVKKGWKVAMSARSEDALKEIEAETGGKARAFPLDVTDTDATREVINRIDTEFGPLVSAVLNAGIYLPVHAECPDIDDFRKTFEVNLVGAANALCVLNPLFAERRKGQIALVSSATGFGGMPTSAAYGASKAALINMAECMRIELDRWGVLMQVITPGFVDTPAQDDNEFPKPFMITADEAANRIAGALRSSRFETTFPKKFTWSLKAIYALPRGMHINLVRKQTGWAKELADGAKPCDRSTHEKDDDKD